jgi:pimeloyl-ACP methyl ester carboxylesterase
MTTVVSRYVTVDGIRTHYLEAGEGAPLVLLHGGEFGGCAELSWELNIEALAQHFRVIAPDYVGFGRTDKLRDFGGHGQRIVRHVSRFVEVMDIGEADWVGNSVSGRFLCRVASDPRPVWPIRRMVVVSGGGFEPDNEERRILQDYDTTVESMRSVLRVLFHDPSWAQDDAYVARRHELSLIPGAWEVAAASRFKSPAVPARPLFGRPDRTEYELITVPTLFVEGLEDVLLPTGYSHELAERTPLGEAVAFEGVGHCPNIEVADAFNEAVLEFLLRPEPAGSGSGADGTLTPQGA